MPVGTERHRCLLEMLLPRVRLFPRPDRLGRPGVESHFVRLLGNVTASRGRSRMTRRSCPPRGRGRCRTGRLPRQAAGRPSRHPRPSRQSPGPDRVGQVDKLDPAGLVRCEPGQRPVAPLQPEVHGARVRLAAEYRTAACELTGGAPVERASPHEPELAWRGRGPREPEPAPGPPCGSSPGPPRRDATCPRGGLPVAVVLNADLQCTLPSSEPTHMTSSILPAWGSWHGDPTRGAL
jgi:hypothetical protein